MVQTPHEEGSLPSKLGCATTLRHHQSGWRLTYFTPPWHITNVKKE